MSLQSRFATEPISQVSTSSVVTGEGERLNTRAVRAPPRAERATPNRIKVSGSRNRAASTTRMASRPRLSRRIRRTASAAGAGERQRAVGGEPGGAAEDRGRQGDDAALARQTADHAVTAGAPTLQGVDDAVEEALHQRAGRI